MSVVERYTAYAKDFSDMAQEFQSRGDDTRMTECLVLAAQYLQVARAFQRMAPTP